MTGRRRERGDENPPEEEPKLEEALALRWRSRRASSSRRSCSRVAGALRLPPPPERFAPLSPRAFASLAASAYAASQRLASSMEFTLPGSGINLTPKDPLHPRRDRIAEAARSRPRVDSSACSSSPLRTERSRTDFGGDAVGGGIDLRPVLMRLRQPLAALLQRLIERRHRLHDLRNRPAVRNLIPLRPRRELLETHELSLRLLHAQRGVVVQFGHQP